jgi:hypothetical protein
MKRQPKERKGVHLDISFIMNLSSNVSMNNHMLLAKLAMR